MHEEFYRLYAAMQETLEALTVGEYRKLDESIKTLIDNSINTLNRYDEADPSCYERWLKEKNDN